MLNETVEAFWEKDGSYNSGLIHATLWDSSLYSDERKKQMNESIAPWQRSFSIEGIPSAGTGAVFAGIDKNTLLEPFIDIQSNWKQIMGVDLGHRDSNVILSITKDPNTNTYYIYDEQADNNTDAVIIASKMKDRQKGFIPAILPRDATFERGLGTTYWKIYEKEGCVLAPELCANWELDPEGKDKSIDAGIKFIRGLMIKGQLKIHPRCNLLLKELSLYAYDDKGKFIDKYNHAIDALRYGVMALNTFGKSEDDYKQKSNRNFYDLQQSMRRGSSW